MKRRHFVTLLASTSALGLVGCSASKFKSYSGPRVTYVLVYKKKRRMYLMHNDEVLKAYKIDLGFAPAGHKIQEGDGRTPEGTYIIDRRNPNSSFHLSLGISYPNAADIARAEALGVEPGGDIFIHGRPNKGSKRGKFWTAGCIAVNNRQMEEIYSMVQNGTPIAIYP